MAKFSTLTQDSLTFHWFYSFFHTLITTHVFFPKHMSDLSVERWILASSTDLLSNRNSKKQLLTSSAIKVWKNCKKKAMTSSASVQFLIQPMLPSFGHHLKLHFEVLPAAIHNIMNLLISNDAFCDSKLILNLISDNFPYICNFISQSLSKGWNSKLTV